MVEPVLGQQRCASARIRNGAISIEVHCGQEALWKFQSSRTGQTFRFAPPLLPLADRRVSAALHEVQMIPLRRISQHITEYSFHGKLLRGHDLALRVTFQINDATDIVRFRYAIQPIGAQSSAEFGPGQVEYFRVTTPLLHEGMEVQLGSLWD